MTSLIHRDIISKIRRTIRKPLLIAACLVLSCALLLVMSYLGGVENRNNLDNLQYQGLFPKSKIAWGRSSGVWGTSFAVAWRNKPPENLISGNSLVWDVPDDQFTSLREQEPPCDLWVGYAAESRKHIAVVECTGLPWRCFYTRIEMMEFDVAVVGGLRWEARGPTPTNPGIVIAWMPRPFFFIANLVTISIGIWLFAVIIVVIKIMVRRPAHDACAGCGYCVGKHCSRCPECGREVVKVDVVAR